MKKLTLFPDEPKPRLTHKGESGKRKAARLLVRKRPIHLILKSRYILLTHKIWIEDRIRDYTDRFGIRIYELAIGHDHIHFAIQIPHVSYYKKFIRSLTGVVARKMGKGIWSLAPFTRVASWGRDFRNLIAYVIKNREEAENRRKYEPRKRRPGKGSTPCPPATLAPCLDDLW